MSWFGEGGASRWSFARGAAVELRHDGQEARWEDVLKELFTSFASPVPQPQAPPAAVSFSEGERAPTEDIEGQVVAFDWSRSKGVFRRICALEFVTDGRAGPSDYVSDLLRHSYFGAASGGPWCGASAPGMHHWLARGNVARRAR